MIIALRTIALPEGFFKVGEEIKNLSKSREEELVDSFLAFHKLGD